VTERVAIKPAKWLEFAVSRIWIFCGKGEPAACVPGLIHLRTTESRQCPGDPSKSGLQKAGFDLRINSPWREIPLPAMPS